MARRGRRRGFGVVLDEWASLVQDRDGIMRHLEALQAAREADRRAHLEETTRLNKIIMQGATNASAKALRKKSKSKARSEVIAEQRHLDIVRAEVSKDHAVGGHAPGAPRGQPGEPVQGCPLCFPNGG